MATNQPTKAQPAVTPRKRTAKTPVEKLVTKCARTLEDIASSYREAASALRKNDAAGYNASLSLAENYEQLFATFNGKLREMLKSEETAAPAE